MNAIKLESRYSANNYAPLPVVLTRGQGAHLWDTDGRRYTEMPAIPSVPLPLFRTLTDAVSE